MRVPISGLPGSRLPNRPMVISGCFSEEDLMKTARASARISVPVSRERSLRSRRPAFAVSPPAEVPDLDTQMDRAVRFGHRLEMFATGSSPAAGFGEVVQRTKTKGDDSDDENDSKNGSENDSEEEDNKDDEDFFLQERTSKSKKQDPKSAMKKETYKKTDTGFEYETEGGSKHIESFNPEKLFRKTKTTDVSLTGPDFRNNALRDNVEHHVFNHYGLSLGQASLNQSVVSHNTSSAFGMRAGGKYGNSSETSGVFNSEVEKKEKKWRDELLGSNNKFDYETETQYEKISENPRIEEIKKLMTNENWQDSERIKKAARRDQQAPPRCQAGLERE